MAFLKIIGGVGGGTTRGACERRRNRPRRLRIEWLNRGLLAAALACVGGLSATSAAAIGAPQAQFAFEAPDGATGVLSVGMAPVDGAVEWRRERDGRATSAGVASISLAWGASAPTTLDTRTPEVRTLETPRAGVLRLTTVAGQVVDGEAELRFPGGAVLRLARHGDEGAWRVDVISPSGRAEAAEGRWIAPEIRTVDRYAAFGRAHATIAVVIAAMLLVALSSVDWRRRARV